MTNQNNSRDGNTGRGDFQRKSLCAADAASKRSGLRTSRQPAAYFPARDFQISVIITEPAVFCSDKSPGKKFPPVSMICPEKTEGATTSTVELILIGDSLFPATSGAAVALNELAREANAARRERR